MDEYGLIALSGLCSGIRERFPLAVLGTYLMHGLSKADDRDVAKQATGIISDLASALG